MAHLTVRTAASWNDCLTVSELFHMIDLINLLDWFNLFDLIHLITSLNRSTALNWFTWLTFWKLFILIDLIDLINLLESFNLFHLTDFINLLKLLESFNSTQSIRFQFFRNVKLYHNMQYQIDLVLQTRDNDQNPFWIIQKLQKLRRPHFMNH